jgi:hypothetical protein
MLLVAVAATPKLLTVAGDTLAERRESHAAVTQLLHAYGVLTFRSEDDRDNFIAALDGIDDPTSRDYWFRLIKFGRQAIIAPPEPASLDVAETAEDLRPWADWVRLAVITPDLARALGCSEEDFSIVLFEDDKPLEVTPYGISHTTSFTQAHEDFSRLQVVPDWTRKDLAQRVLIPVMRFAESIVIHDRYLGEALFREPERKQHDLASGGAAAAEDEAVDGEVEWMLKLVNKVVDGSADVTLLTTYTRDPRAEGRKMLARLTPILERVWAGGVDGLASVALRILPRKGKDIFGQPYLSAHDRCIQATYPRFDRIFAAPAAETTSFLEFSAGMGRLGRPLRFRNDRYSIAFTPSRLRKVSQNHHTLVSRVSEDLARSDLVAEIDHRSLRRAAGFGSHSASPR